MRRDSPRASGPAARPAGLPLPFRRRLRALAGVELWHIEDPKTQGQRTPTVRYFVKAGSSEATFERPHEAWRYFQQLTGAPERDTRPPPPPLEATLGQPRIKKPRRRRSDET